VEADQRGEQLLVFDLETQRSAEEVGGWANAHRMGLALAVVYDVRRDVYRTYYEADVHRLLLDLVMADCVVGFNIERFDLPVLSAYTDWDLKRIRTLDLLARIRSQLGFRISLNHLAETNLGESKAGDGLQSLRWWKEGRIDLIEHYCRKDVEVTRRLYELGRNQRYLLYRDHSQRVVRVPVGW
jgi:DEAD/DEAH box helicase domain-containing protein